MSDRPISRFDVPDLDDLPDDIREQILAVQEKSGFVPNVFLAFARRPAEFRAFFAFHDVLMDSNEGLSKAERELIVVATSAVNSCLYCVVAHGAILRIRAKNPLLADQVATNPAKADLTERERNIVDYALKVATDSANVGDADLDAMRGERIQRRRDLGHRCDHGTVRAVEPLRELHRHATERRVLRNGPLNAGSGTRAENIPTRREPDRRSLRTGDREHLPDLSPNHRRRRCRPHTHPHRLWW